MKTKSILKSQEGFTLVEIIAVLIILGILAAVAVPRYLDLETSSKNRALEAAVAELNGRESLAWADTKISMTGGWTGTTDNDKVWNKIFVTPGNKIDLGTDYTWTGTPSRTGGSELNFRGSKVAITRSISTGSQPAIWAK